MMHIQSLEYLIALERSNSNNSVIYGSAARLVGENSATTLKNYLTVYQGVG